jgi:transcriptional regulator with XRE-family HTH domain
MVDKARAWCHDPSTTEQGVSSVLAARLAELRKAAGLSQPQLSFRTDVAINTISHIETGEETNPKLQTLEKLARGLGVTVHDLLGDPEGAATFP